MKPRIGITCTRGEDDFTLRPQYVEAVVLAGGIPILLPAAAGVAPEDAAGAVDGVLLSGGGDVDPDWYGEEPHVANGRINPEADRFEIELCRLMLREDRPVLGICRGVQVLNVAAGGSLYQDLGVQTGTTLQHAQKAPGWHATHRVDVLEGTLLREIVGEDSLRVNSFHHQGIHRLAPGFRVGARATDGLIEAIERPGARWILGVQWHPERTVTHSAADRALFEAFVKACAGAAA